MPWSGGAFTRTNGVHTGATVWAQDRDAGTKILAARHDTHDQDLAGGINSTLEKSGSNAATGNLNIGSNRLTAVADGTAKTDAATVNQIQSNAPAYQATDTGTANAHVIALSPAITAYASGQKVTFKSGSANTTASTLNVNGLGVKAIKKLHDQDVASGDIESGSIVTVVYDGTNFQMTSQVAASASAAPAAATSAKTAAYTVVAGDAGSTILCSAASANYSVALTAAATLGNGFTVTLKKSDDSKFMITISPNGSEAIDGLLDLKLRNEHSEATLICDGSNWHLVSHENVAIENNACENGGFLVDQYSHITRTGAGAADAHVQDRWMVLTAGSASARWTYSRELNGGVNGDSAWAKLLVTTADGSPGAAEGQGFRQSLIGNNAVQFLGADNKFENAVFSMDMIVHKGGGSSISLPAKVPLFFTAIDGTQRMFVQDVSIAAVDTWYRVSIVVPEDATANMVPGVQRSSGFGIGLYGGSNFNTTSGNWVNGYEGYGTGTSSNLADATDNYVGITNCKFQQGQILTPFSSRPYAEELDICKYYAEKLSYDTNSYQLVAVGGFSANNAIQASITYEEKRATPAITSSAAGTFQLNSYAVGGNDATSVGYNEPGKTNFRFAAEYGGTGYTQDNAGQIRRDTGDDTYIFITSEI